MSELIRLSRLMSMRGLSSRREADQLIEQGLVCVDGKVVNKLGSKFQSDVEITLSERARKIQQRRVTIMFNKPVGVVSAQAEKDYVPAVRLINLQSHSDIDNSKIKLLPEHFTGLAPAGRLDIDSQGLLILTQDGRVAKKLIGENAEIEKEYLVRIKEVVTPQQIRDLSYGLSLDGKKLKKAKVQQLNAEQLRFVLREGKKRQIRRMAEAVGLTVIGLKRVRIGNLRLGKLKEGEWRFVQEKDFFHK